MAILDCCENLSMPPCIWFEGDRRNTYASVVAGFLFFVGWWTIIDAASVYPGTIAAGYHMCGVVATISFIMVNSVSNAQFRGDGFEGGCLGSRGARIWLFLGFVMGFASCIASCWILFAVFVTDPVNPPKMLDALTTMLPPTPVLHSWPGVALFLQNALIFIASLLFKFGRTDDAWS